MRETLLVGCGGFVGAASRYLMGEFLLRYAIAARFPIGTLAVNGIGCFLIGLLAGYLGRDSASVELRLFVLTGILGGFTTFSAFGYETVQLVRQEQVFFAVTNVAANLLGCLLAVVLGLWIASALSR